MSKENMENVSLCPERSGISKTNFTPNYTSPPQLVASFPTDFSDTISNRDSLIQSLSARYSQMKAKYFNSGTNKTFAFTLSKEPLQTSNLHVKHGNYSSGEQRVKKYNFFPKKYSQLDSVASGCDYNCQATKPFENELTDIKHLNNLIFKSTTDIWSSFKKQEEKLNELQNKISVVLEEKDLCIKQQNEQISKLQDQIEILMKQTEEFEPFQTKSRTSSVTHEPSEVACNNICTVLPNEEKNYNSDNKSYEVDENIQYLEQISVKQNSTSAMTSFTLDFSDVHGKKLTVITNISNCQRDISIKCSQEESPFETDATPKFRKKYDCPKCNRETNFKSVKDTSQEESPFETGATPKLRKKNDCSKYNRETNFKNVKDTSSKCADLKKHHKSPRFQIDLLNRSGEKFKELNTNYQSNLNSDFNIDPQPRSKNTESPLNHSDRENRLIKERKIVRHFKENNTENELELSPSEVKRFQSNNYYLYDNSIKNEISPRACSSSNKRKSKSKKNSSKSSSTSSNTSVDFHHESPHSKESKDLLSDSYNHLSTVSLYGLSSPNLSLGTKRYLENYGLDRGISSSHSD